MAITAMMRIRQRRWNICSFMRCLCVCRNIIVPEVSRSFPTEFEPTVQADNNPHEEGGQGEGEREDEQHDHQ